MLMNYTQVSGLIVYFRSVACKTSTPKFIYLSYIIFMSYYFILGYSFILYLRETRLLYLIWLSFEEL